MCWAGAASQDGFLIQRMVWDYWRQSLLTDIEMYPNRCLQRFYIFCELNKLGVTSLKKDHQYFSQVQGQLGICGVDWCDFVVYTNKGMDIERILFDAVYFHTMMNKLYDCYT